MDLLIVCRAMCNEFYLNFKLNFAENTEYDAATLVWIGPVEVG